MKKLFVFLIALLASLSAFSQTEIELKGVYKNKLDSIYFQNDSVSFIIWSDGAFITPLAGEGVYRISDSLLIIKTDSVAPDLLNKRNDWRLADTTYLHLKTLVFVIHKANNKQLWCTWIGTTDSHTFKGRRTIKRFYKNHMKFVFRQRKLSR